MRLFPFLILFLVITACNNSAEKKEDIKDTITPVTQVPETPAVPDTIFTGIGTEPFWAVYVINNNKIVFHPADGPDVEVPFVAAAAAGNDTMRYSSATGTTSMELTIIKKDCSDGMSERTHPWEVALLINATKYSGCGIEK